ncbi:MAG: peptidoglycan DD-metalloendopeptidase family protein [Nitrosomonadales bacterium]|nr:peptidoglycan DD-metalloendopeptidase family protein [Nitrosomonadales bacterium]
MMPDARTLRLPLLALAAALLAGCSSSGGHAPVMERGAAGKKPVELPLAVAAKKTPPPENLAPENDWRPQTYVVQKGDTLYSIAFNHGLDYHEIADLNGIQNPGIIRVGQEIRLFQPNAAAAARPAQEIKPEAEIKPQEIFVRDYPKVAKLPYSEQAVAEIEKMQEAAQQPAPAMLVKAEPKPEIRPAPRPVAATSDSGEAGDGITDWDMPTSGKVIGEFSESTNQKGIDVAGKRGQAVVASAAGKVVYSGSGLRGYGKLVIIKHNKTYLSAYAHNDQILVKEGQTVAKGQKIAEMGNTDADQVKLHFEIRKFGKPVDPAKYLPLIKS